MSFVTSRQLLLDAQKGGYAVGAFNIENMEMAMAAVAAAEEVNLPLILQTTPSTVRYGGLRLFHGIVSALAESSVVPVALHLDHGDSFELVDGALCAGYTSVMIDGSHSPFDENVAITKRAVMAAKSPGIPVEAELGKVGGKEDDLEAGTGIYTDPEEAKEFVALTNVFSLAVAIGTAHGIYADTPVLDVERLSAIRRVVDIPLVLHGASGLSDESIRDCVRRGICKVNFATELRIAYSDGVKAMLADQPDTFDPKSYGKAGMAQVKELVRSKMLLLR